MHLRNKSKAHLAYCERVVFSSANNVISEYGSWFPAYLPLGLVIHNPNCVGPESHQSKVSWISVIKIQIPKCGLFEIRHLIMRLNIDKYIRLKAYIGQFLVLLTEQIIGINDQNFHESMKI